MARRAAEYGIDISVPLRVDMARVKARKDRVSGASRQGVERWVRDLPRCTVLKGHARFETPHRMIVGDEPIEGERIFLNVGGRAVVPDSDVYAAIDLIRQANGRLISVTAVRESLEDYFFERLNAPGVKQ